MNYINDFQKSANSGFDVDENLFKDFLKSFDSIIIWGAGNLGTAIGKRIKDFGIEISTYWDIRADKLNNCNNVQVTSPFDGEYDKSKTLVIFAIANVPVSPGLLKKLIDDGWPNIIRGLDILQGIMCPLSVEAEVDVNFCNNSDMCTVCSCERLSNIVKYKMMNKRNMDESEIISFDRIHFLVNNFCNLKCKNCFLYMNSYLNDRKKNVSFERISKDMDMVFKAVNSFGVVNIFGGETFLNPEISKIVDVVLEYENFGALIVSTNGVANIKKDQLSSFINPRVRLAFSNYIGSINKIQEEKFYSNIEMASKLGINAKAQNELPNWNIPSTLEDKHFSEERKIINKSNCGVVFLYVFDGKIFPCAFSFSLYDLGVADYEETYIEIDKMGSPEELRERIREMINLPSYRSCSHCEAPINCLAQGAGEQGFDERLIVPIKGV